MYASWSPDKNPSWRSMKMVSQIKIFETQTGAEIIELIVDDPDSGIGINPNGWAPWSPTGDRVDGHVR